MTILYGPTQYPSSIPTTVYTYTPQVANDRCSAVCAECGIQYEATAANADFAETRVVAWMKAHPARCPERGGETSD